MPDAQVIAFPTQDPDPPESDEWLTTLKFSEDWAEITSEVAFIDTTDNPAAARDAIAKLRVLVLGIHDG